MADDKNIDPRQEVSNEIHNEINKQSETGVNFDKNTQQPEISDKEETQFSGNTPADKIEVPPVRTYLQDLNRTVNRNNVTPSKILLAEQKRMEKTQIPPPPQEPTKAVPVPPKEFQKKEVVQHNVPELTLSQPVQKTTSAPITLPYEKPGKNSITRTRNKIFLFLSVLLIAAAIIVGLYAGYNWLAGIGSNPVQKVVEREGNFISIDNMVTVNISERFRNDIEDEIYTNIGSSYPDKTITEIVLVRKVDDELQRIPTSTFNNLLELRLPTLFKRSLSNDYLFGVYTLGDDNKPFIIYKLLDFENAFDSIFDYEREIAEDLKDIFNKFPEFNELQRIREGRQEFFDEMDGLLDATSTATTTGEILDDATVSTTTATTTVPEIDFNEKILELEDLLNVYRNFIDLVVQNTDTRAVVGENNNVMIYYSFINQDNWLLIADDVEVLREVKRRIREKTLVR